MIFLCSVNNIQFYTLLTYIKQLFRLDLQKYSLLEHYNAESSLSSNGTHFWHKLPTAFLISIDLSKFWPVVQN